MSPQQVAGLSIQPHPTSGGMSILVFEWRSGATGRWLTLSTNVMDWNPYAMAKTLRDFSDFIVRRHKEDIAEGKVKK